MGDIQQQLQPENQSFWQMLWASPLLLLTLFIRSLRDWVASKISNLFKTKERREDVITRAEFEARMSAMDKKLDDHGNKLDAHSATARIDNRELEARITASINELKHDMKSLGHDLFNKMDNFLTTILSVRRDK